MIKSILAAAVLGLLSMGGAMAQQSTTDAGKCMEAASDLASAAEQKQLANDKLDKIEDLLTKMEDLCDADRVPEAMALAKDIEAEINAQ